MCLSSKVKRFVERQNCPLRTKEDAAVQRCTKGRAGDFLAKKIGGKKHCREFSWGLREERCPLLIIFIGHLLSSGCWSPWECPALPRSLGSTGRQPALPCLRGSKERSSAKAGEETGRGMPANPPLHTHLPAFPGHLITLTRLHLRVPAAALCRATFKGSPVLARQVPGQTPARPSSLPPPLTWGKLSEFGPSLPKEGGCRGCSAGAGPDFPPSSEEERDPPVPPLQLLGAEPSGSIWAVVGNYFSDTARQGTRINNSWVLKGLLDGFIAQ